jgi:hypothetical protein
MPDAPLQAIVEHAAAGRYKAKPSRVFRFDDIREVFRDGIESGEWHDGRGRLRRTRSESIELRAFGALSMHFHDSEPDMVVSPLGFKAQSKG